MKALRRNEYPAGTWSPLIGRWCLAKQPMSGNFVSARIGAYCGLKIANAHGCLEPLYGLVISGWNDSQNDDFSWAFRWELLVLNRKPARGVCAICGCTEGNACLTASGPCSWFNMGHSVCSRCASPWFERWLIRYGREERCRQRRADRRSGR